MAGRACQNCSKANSWAKISKINVVKFACAPINSRFVTKKCFAGLAVRITGGPVRTPDGSVYFIELSKNT